MKNLRPRKENARMDIPHKVFWRYDNYNHHFTLKFYNMLFVYLMASRINKLSQAWCEFTGGYLVTHRNKEKAECFLEAVERSKSKFKGPPCRNHLTLWLNSCSHFSVSGKRGPIAVTLGMCLLMVFTGQKEVWPVKVSRFSFGFRSWGAPWFNT